MAALHILLKSSRLATQWVRRLRQRVRQSGRTLIETMLAVCVVALLCATGIPKFTEVVRDTRLSTHVSQFLAANAYARSEAIRRGQLVTICRAVRADQGIDECSDNPVGSHGGRDWASGWLVFAEAGGTIGQVDGDDEILLRQGMLGNETQGEATMLAITWTAQGVPLNLAGGRLQFSWDGKQRRLLCIARSGRTRVVRDADRCDA